MKMLSSKGCCQRKVCPSSDRKAVKYPHPAPLCSKKRFKNSMNPQKSLELASGPFPGDQLGFLSYTWGFLLLVSFCKTKISPCSPGWIGTPNNPSAS